MPGCNPLENLEFANADAGEIEDSLKGARAACAEDERPAAPRHVFAGILRFPVDGGEIIEVIWIPGKKSAG
jgi:hypothetical protein